MDDDGRFAHTDDLPVEQQMPAELLGKSILEKHGKSDANEAVLHELRVRKALVHQENYHHSYPHCWRSKTPVIFRAMDQWFIEIDHASLAAGTGTFRAQALGRDRPRPLGARLGQEPDRGRRYRPSGLVHLAPALLGRADPGVLRRASGKPILDARIVRNAADLVEQHGSNVWFEKTAAELWALVQPERLDRTRSRSRNPPTRWMCGSTPAPPRALS